MVNCFFFGFPFNFIDLEVVIIELLVVVIEVIRIEAAEDGGSGLVVNLRTAIFVFVAAVDRSGAGIHRSGAAILRLRARPLMVDMQLNFFQFESFSSSWHDGRRERERCKGFVLVFVLFHWEVIFFCNRCIFVLI